MILENDFKICYNQRETQIMENNWKKDELQSKEEEIKSLNEKIITMESNYKSIDQLAQFEIEMKLIRQQLIEKTNELINFDTYHKRTLEDNLEEINELKEKEEYYLNENSKFRKIINDVIKYYKEGNEPGLTNILEYLAVHSKDFEDKNNNSFNEGEDSFI